MVPGSGSTVVVDEESAAWAALRRRRAGVYVSRRTRMPIARTIVSIMLTM